MNILTIAYHAHAQLLHLVTILARKFPPGWKFPKGKRTGQSAGLATWIRAVHSTFFVQCVHSVT